MGHLAASFHPDVEIARRETPPHALQFRFAYRRRGELEMLETIVQLPTYQAVERNFDGALGNCRPVGRGKKINAFTLVVRP